MRNWDAYAANEAVIVAVGGGVWATGGSGERRRGRRVESIEVTYQTRPPDA